MEFRNVDWIEGIPKGLYRVSDDGRVWRPWRKTGRLRPLITRRGVVVFSYLDRQSGSRVRKVLSVSTLICRAFHGPRPIGCIPFRFPDRSPTNNSASNLRWMPQGSQAVGNDWAATSPTCRKGEPFALGKWKRPTHWKPQAILTREDIPVIFAMRRDGMSNAEIAAEYGVGAACISHVITGRTWADVECDRSKGVHRIVRNSAISAADIPRIFELRRDGWDFKEIAAEYGSSATAICGVLRGERYAYVECDRTLPSGLTKRRGAFHKDAIMGEDDIREVRRRRSAGELLVTLAREFGVSHTTISRIVRRQSWKYVD